MTQYLSTLTLEALDALTLEELSTLGINEPIDTSSFGWQSTVDVFYESPHSVDIYV